MPSQFRRPVGAQADVKELEYLAALHQTCMPACRENGTVSSKDVVTFLKSRLGLIISHQQGLELVRGLGGGQVGDDVISSILQGMPSSSLRQESVQKKTLFGAIKKAGTRKKRNSSEEELEQQLPEKDGDELEEYLDIVQLFSVILMPTLARAGQEWHDARTPLAQEVEREEESMQESDKGMLQKRRAQRQEKQKERDDAIHESLRPKPDSLMSDVLAMMLASVDTTVASGESYPTLTADLVRDLLLAGEEHERAADSVLVEKMVEAASSSSGLFDEDAFVNAMTSDLKKWNVGCEDKETSTFYDVWGFESYREKLAVEAEEQKMLSEEKVASDEKVQSEVYAKKKTSTNVASVSNKDAVSPKDAKTGEVIDVAQDTESQAASNDEMSTEAATSLAKNKGFQGNSRKQGGLEAVASSIEDAGSQGTADKETSANISNVSGEGDKDKYELDRFRVPWDIDFAVDAHSSVALSITIFFFFSCTAIVYATLVSLTDGVQNPCEESGFGCKLGTTVLVWMVLAIILTATGIVVVIPLSIGNNPAERSPIRLIIALMLAIIYNWVPFTIVKDYQNRMEPPYSNVEMTIQDYKFEIGRWITRVSGLLVTLAMLIQLPLAAIGNRRIRSSKFLSTWFNTSNVRGSARLKKAATRKVNSILENALKLHPGKAPEDQYGSSHSEETMTNYVLHGEELDYCGGLSWTFKKLVSGALFDEEGIWIMTRLVIVQTVQIAFFFIMSFVAFIAVDIAAEQAGKNRQKLEEYPDDYFPQWVYDIVPTPQQIRFAFYPATIVMMIMMIVIFTAYIPSYVGYVLKYRSGVLESLRSPDFSKYRIAVDTVYTNVGNAIYALIGSSVLFFLLVALVIFLFIWPFSRDTMILLVAWVVGLVITIALKQILVRLCRMSFYAAFYRTQPNRANLSTLALECWFLGLGGGVLVGRFTQFIFAAILFVGRTDVPFLSTDVALFGYAFDYVPRNFIKDILVHEAHRHPFFERLLAVYMMKLRNKNFCSEAGACWRQLFVVTLMPWMVKMRVFSDARLSDAAVAYNVRRSDSVKTFRRSRLVGSVRIKEQKTEVE